MEHLLCASQHFRCLISNSASSLHDESGRCHWTHPPEVPLSGWWKKPVSWLEGWEGWVSNRNPFGKYIYWEFQLPADLSAWETVCWPSCSFSLCPCLPPFYSLSPSFSLPLPRFCPLLSSLPLCQKIPLLLQSFRLPPCLRDFLTQCFSPLRERVIADGCSNPFLKGENHLPQPLLIETWAS